MAKHADGPASGRMEFGGQTRWHTIKQLNSTTRAKKKMPKIFAKLHEIEHEGIRDLIENYDNGPRQLLHAWVMALKVLGGEKALDDFLGQPWREYFGEEVIHELRGVYVDMEYVDERVEKGPQFRAHYIRRLLREAHTLPQVSEHDARLTQEEEAADLIRREQERRRQIALKHIKK